VAILCISKTVNYEIATLFSTICGDISNAIINPNIVMKCFVSVTWFFIGNI
jgi:hypothetical protein